MTALQTQIAPLEALERVLPNLLNNLSLARAQIAIDQIRSAVATQSRDRILFVTAVERDSASRPDSESQPIAAAIAIQHSTANQVDADDSATIIHAGALADSPDRDHRSIMSSLSDCVDSELSQRGVRFLQWATDPAESADGDSGSVFPWCVGFGFQPIGTLDYLAGDVAAPDDAAANDAPPKSGTGGFHIQPVEWNGTDEWTEMADVVDRTYVQTLDCPDLANFRTASQTLRSYQASNAFDPNLWFLAFDSEGNKIGCVVMANHDSTVDNAQEPSPPVIEMVYMGLVPEARGRGGGAMLLEQAMLAASDIGAERMILAVDQRNKPARALYDSAGLQPMLTETVWVKSLG